MPGPGGPGGPHGGRPMQKPKNVGSTIKRIFSYMGKYRMFLIVVTIAIICSSLANVIGTSFLQKIIDNYLTPMAGHYDATLMRGFVLTLLQMGSIYLVGALCTYLSARTMLNISTKVLYQIRVDMFTHMESLPIR